MSRLLVFLFAATAFLSPSLFAAGVATIVCEHRVNGQVRYTGEFEVKEVEGECKVGATYPTRPGYSSCVIKTCH